MAGERKNKDFITVGGLFPVALIDSFKELCSNSGLSMRQAIERCMSDCVRNKRVPGVEMIAWGKERRNAEKFGDGGTERYDGDETKDPEPLKSDTTDRAIS